MTINKCLLILLMALAVLPACDVDVVRTEGGARRPEHNVNPPVGKPPLKTKSPAKEEEDTQEQKAERRERIADAIRKKTFPYKLVDELKTPEDLIFAVKESTKAHAEEMLEKDKSGVFTSFGYNLDETIAPLFSRFDGPYRQLKEKLGDVIGMAARNVDGYVESLDFMASLGLVYRSLIEDSDLSEDEILEFLERVNQTDKATYGEKPGYDAMLVMAGKGIGVTFDSITRFYKKDDPVLHRTDAKNQKRLGVFRRFFSGDEFNRERAFADSLRHHDPELLREVLTVGHVDPVTKKINLAASDEEVTEEKRSLVSLLESHNVGKRQYGDYYRLRDTIDILIRAGILSVKDFFYYHTLDEIVDSFVPDKNYGLFNTLQSPHIDLNTLMKLAKKYDLSYLEGTFYFLIKNASEGGEGSLRGCQFLRNNFHALEANVKTALLTHLNRPENKKFKEQHFTGLDF